jgi:hypothetical protein
MRKRFKYKIGDILERTTCDHVFGVLTDYYIVYKRLRVQYRKSERPAHEYILYDIAMSSTTVMPKNFVDNPALVQYYATSYGSKNEASLLTWRRVSKD